MAIARLNLGAPGVYRHPEESSPVLLGVRMDVCAFLGVAPRGPVREPVLDEAWLFDRPCVEPGRERRRSVARTVESFGEYRRLYGGFEGPGRLPFAVASFFEQGGRRAYVVRIVHEYGDALQNAAAVAAGTLTGAVPTAGDLRLVARDEGAWGNRLRAALGFSLTPLGLADAAAGQLLLDPDEGLPTGSLLRLRLPAGTHELRFVSELVRRPRSNGHGELLHAVLDQPAADVPDAAEVVEGILLVDDGDGRVERHEGLGLSRAHGRFLGTVLCYESELVYPEASWVEGDLLPNDAEDLPRQPVLPPAEPPQFAGGQDRYADVVPDDFFDPGWAPGDPEPGSGVHALTHLRDLSSVVAADLYSPSPLPGTEGVLEAPPAAGPTFEPCLPPPPTAAQAEATGELEGLFLDPGDPADLEKITTHQLALVRLAELLRSFVVLLDVPPGLSHRQVLRWRSRFASSFAAAYHPWLRVSRRDDLRDALVRVNPAAVAAGVIARQESLFGVPYGPANVLAATVVDVEEEISPHRHDELHPLGVNVYLRERDGVRLTAGRTLSRDPRYRQLSVRRLMTLLRRVLEQQTHWMVFEPNGPALRSQVRRLLTNYLRRLYEVGAFRGATPEEAFFVRCDETLNPQRVLDAGQMIAEIGVAPAEPVEFLVLRLTRDGDGTLTVES